MRAARRAHRRRPAGRDVAIIGAGTIGLLTLAAVREAAPSATLIAVAKHAGQQTAARRFGADDVCAPDRLYIEGARITHSRRLVGHQSREMLLGGFDRVLDCVGTGTSIEQAITITRPRGRVVLVGMPGELKADLAAAWLRELELRGAYGYENDFPRALEFARTLKPGRLIDRGWPLRAFKKASRHAPESRARGPRQDRLRDRRMSIAPDPHDRAHQAPPARPPSAKRASSRSTSTRRRRCSTPASRSGSSGCPVGSRIVYPPPPLKGLIDVDAAICRRAGLAARAWTRWTRC